MPPSTPLPNGWIITAKGKRLNLSELITKSNKPISDKNIDLKDKVSPQRKPKNQPNVQGFMPDTSHVAAPPIIEVDESNHDDNSNTTLADITGVTIRKPKFLKERPVNPMEEASKALAEITSDLANMNKPKAIKR
jgi:hypothetical protein